MTYFLLTVEHENGKTRHFGPYDSSEEALEVGQGFCFDNTPYFVSVFGLTKPDANFVERAIKQDQEEENGL